MSTTFSPNDTTPPPGYPQLEGGAPVPSVGIPPTHDALIYGTCIAMVVFASFILGLRIFSRIRLIRYFDWSDIIACFATAVTVAMATVFCINVTFGMGKHIGDIQHEKETLVEKLYWISLIIYPFALGFTKLSILFYLLRLSQKNRMFRIAVYSTMTFVVVLTLVTAFLTALQCRPPQVVYDRAYRGPCLDRATLYYTTAAFSVATDVFLVLMPLPMVLKVQITRKQKIILFFVFLLGGVVCIASAIRFTIIFRMTRSTDPTWVMASFSVWTVTECSLAIVCACVPALKPLAAHYLPKLISSTLGASGQGRKSDMSFPLTDISAGKHDRSSGRGSTLVRAMSVSGTGLREKVREPLHFWGDGSSEEAMVEPLRVMKTTDISVDEEPYLKSMDKSSPTSSRWA